MALSGRRGSGGMANLIERQMRNWELARGREQKEAERPAHARSVKFYLAISRECGCGEEEVLARLARRTGFQKFDREVLDYMVSRDDVRRKLYETLDDRTVGWIEDVCSALSFGPAVGELEYFNRLSRALLAICHHTHAMIVGRGANFILPRAQGLAVRMVAPLDYRVEHYARIKQMEVKSARAEMQRIDETRSQFIENRFGKYAYDPRRYDLVINVSQFSSEDQVCEIIVTALQAKAGPKLRLPVTARIEA